LETYVYIAKESEEYNKQKWNKQYTFRVNITLIEVPKE
jgi:hypothetical protein